MSTSTPITVALAQVRQHADIRRNMKEIRWALDSAAQHGSGLLLFPECALTGYGPAHHHNPAALQPAPIQRAMEELGGLIKHAGIPVLIGAHLPSDAGYTNSAILFSAAGRQIARYDKAHLYGDDPAFYRPGDQSPPARRVAGVRLGLQICFDIRFPEVSRRLVLNGAQLIAVPSHIHGKNNMWKRPVIASHVSSRAAENGRFVLFINAAGHHQNVPSMIADPRGIIITKARARVQQLLIATLDLSQVSNTFLNTRRPELYA